MKKIIFIFLGVFIVFSCEEIINEENISSDLIIALAPTNNSALKTGEQINYNWQGVSGATNYELQIAAPNFSQAAQIQLDTVITTTLFALDSLKAGNYEWRIKALNSVFETGYTTNGFTVADN